MYTNHLPRQNLQRAFPPRSHSFATPLQINLCPLFEQSLESLTCVCSGEAVRERDRFIIIDIYRIVIMRDFILGFQFVIYKKRPMCSELLVGYDS